MLSSNESQRQTIFADLQAKKRAILAEIEGYQVEQPKQTSPKKRKISSEANVDVETVEDEVLPTLGVLEVTRGIRGWKKLVENPFLFNDPRLVFFHDYLRRHYGECEVEGDAAPIVEDVSFGVLELAALRSIWSKIEASPMLFEDSRLSFFAETLDAVNS